MKKYSDKELFQVIKKKYLDRGLHVLPCHPNSKLAIGKKWQDIATVNETQVKEWIKKHPGCNWAVLPNKSGHVIADIDLSVDPKFESTGLEHFEALLDKNGRPETMVSRTGSGGNHYIFKAIEGEKYSGKFDGHKGIDIRHKNYIVVYPSVHENGNQYVWIDESPIAPFPEWMKDGFKGKKKTEISKAPKKEKNLFNWIDYISDFKIIAEQLKDKDFDYLEWVKIGMSIHSMIPYEEGLDLFLTITHGKNFVEGDDEGARYRWAGFEWGIDQGVTEKTYIWIARQKGCEIPAGLEDLFDEWDIQNAYDRIKMEAEEHPEFFIDWSDRNVTVHKEFLIEWMNERYTMMSVDPKNKIVSMETSPQGVKDATVLQTDNFHLYFQNRFYKYYDYSGRRPKAKYIPVSQVWVQAPNRGEHSKIVFRPAAEPGELNLWSGIPCTGVEGNVDLFIELCEQVFANGNKAKGQWFIQWCAHIIQQPDVKCTLVPVLIGDQGTGKGLFADGIMKGILGPFFTRITKSSEFTEKFNKEYSKKFLTFIDEATWRGDKTEDGIMKSLTGSDTMMVEEKFGARYTIENFSRYYIASNNEDAVAIERSNRRYMMFMVNNNYRQKKEFFGQFWDGIKKGDMVQRIYHYLKNVDLSTFDPFTLPVFDFEATDAKLATEGVIAQFWAHLLFEDPRPIFVKGNYLVKNVVFNEFLEFHKESKAWQKGISRQAFWKKTGKYVKNLHLKETRLSTGNAFQRVYKIGINELFRNFSSSLDIKMSEDFDELDYMIEDDFEN